MATLYEYYVTGDNFTFYSPTLITTPPPPDITVRVKLAQTFTPQITHAISQVRLFLLRVGSPGTFTVGIYAVDGSNHPTGAALCSGTSNGNTLTTGAGGGGRDIFMGTPALLTASTIYAIVLEAPDAVAGTSGVGWRCDTTGAYAGGQGLSYPEEIDDETTADDWFDLGNANLDFKFAEYGTAPASKPTNPTPANSATGVDFSGRVLDWDDGGGADTFDVWVGPTGALIKVASAITPSTYTVDLVDVPTDQVVYWRVDATNGAGTTTGDTWNFDARPVKANTPSPADSGSSITLDETPLGWVDGGNADTYNVYFGESGSEVLVGSAQAGVEFTIDFGTLDYNITYGWRIDSINDFGTTTGDTWTFDTISFDTILPGAVGGGGGGGGGGGSGEESSPTGENNMITLRRLVAAANNKIWYEDV